MYAFINSLIVALTTFISGNKADLHQAAHFTTFVSYTQTFTQINWNTFTKCYRIVLVRYSGVGLGERIDD